VLVEGGADGVVRSLSSVVDGALAEFAPRGIEGERLRRHVLRLECELRVLVRDGARGMLSDLWEKAAANIAAEGVENVGEILAHTGAQVTVDGEVVDCDHELPARLVEYAWRVTQQRKARRFHEEVDRLVQALSDILRAALHPFRGRAAAGKPARVARRSPPRPVRLRRHVAPARQERTRGRVRRAAWADRVALDALRRQRFFEPSPGAGLEQSAEPPYEHRFSTCVEAKDAFGERLGELVEFVKAMSIAELEADGRYVESRHDPFFAGFGEDALTPDDLALFPDYLVCLEPGHTDAAESGVLMEVLSSDLPVKVLVQTEDVLEESSLGAGHFGFGLRNVQLASTAMGLRRLRPPDDELEPLPARRPARGRLAYAGPALFSVFSLGRAGRRPAAYLTAAAAIGARVRRLHL
jgi:hypothetical protein